METQLYDDNIQIKNRLNFNVYELIITILRLIPCLSNPRAMSDTALPEICGYDFIHIANQDWDFQSRAFLFYKNKMFKTSCQDRSPTKKKDFEWYQLWSSVFVST